MKIEHIGIWAKNLELLKNFYVEHFNAIANTKYYNRKKQFSSYFLSFENGARLEIMHSQNERNTNGLFHIAISVGSTSAVDDFYEYALLKEVNVLNQPRETGDGYYEFILEDPEKNQIEVTV